MPYWWIVVVLAAAAPSDTVLRVSAAFLKCLCGDIRTARPNRFVCIPFGNPRCRTNSPSILSSYYSEVDIGTASIVHFPVHTFRIPLPLGCT